MLFKKLNSAESKSFIRKLLWVSKQVFVNQFVPVLTGVVTKVLADVVKDAAIPETSSPFLTGHVFNEKTIDGAMMAGVSTRAWAKYAVPKGLPKPGQKALVIENEPHEANDFDGEIKEGYGKGTKTLLLSDNVIVKVGGRSSVQKINYHVHDADVAGLHYDLVVTGIKPGAKQWELNIPRGEFKGRYAFVQTPRGMIVTTMTDRGLQIPKPSYTLRSEDLLMEVDPSKNSIERKLDGSLGNVIIDGQRAIFRSHRDGGDTYYDKLPAVEFIKNESPFFASRLLYPGPSLTGTVFQGELVHPEGSARVSGILNSLAPNARAIQQERGPVKYYVWDIIKYKGRDVSGKPYAERRALYESIVKDIRAVNKNWDVVESLDPRRFAAQRALNAFLETPGLSPEQKAAIQSDFERWSAANAPETPKQFYDRVTKDPLPYGEGVVIKPLNASAQRWDKMKMTGFGYFKLVDILPGEGKYAGSVGRVVVENLENGAQGEVGSLSVSDDFRNWIWQHRDDLLGETVKVRSQEITARGVPRAGVLYGFHNGEIDLLMAAESAVAGTGKDYHDTMYAMKTAAGWKRK